MVGGPGLAVFFYMMIKKNQYFCHEAVNAVEQPLDGHMQHNGLRTVHSTAKVLQPGGF